MVKEIWKNKFFKDDDGNIIAFDLYPIVRKGDGKIRIDVGIYRYVNSSKDGLIQIEAYERWLNRESVEVRSCKNCRYDFRSRLCNPCVYCQNFDRWES